MLAPVTKANLHGFIDRSSKVVIPLTYRYADSFNNGKAMVVDGSGKREYIDKNGNEVSSH